MESLPPVIINLVISRYLTLDEFINIGLVNTFMHRICKVHLALIAKLPDPLPRLLHLGYKLSGQFLYQYIRGLEQWGIRSICVHHSKEIDNEIIKEIKGLGIIKTVQMSSPPLAYAHCTYQTKDWCDYQELGPCMLTRTSFWLYSKSISLSKRMIGLKNNRDDNSFHYFIRKDFSVKWCHPVPPKVKTDEKNVIHYLRECLGYDIISLLDACKGRLWVSGTTILDYLYFGNTTSRRKLLTTNYKDTSDVCDAMMNSRTRQSFNEICSLEVCLDNMDINLCSFSLLCSRFNGKEFQSLFSWSELTNGIAYVPHQSNSSKHCMPDERYFEAGIIFKKSPKDSNYICDCGCNNDDE